MSFKTTVIARMRSIRGNLHNAENGIVKMISGSLKPLPSLRAVAGNGVAISLNKKDFVVY
ncbi:MAG: hypothetical protein IKZ88_04055 [Neisseriaceae bacterium]|nr:hypothetical protein [Neisseriaceae bacterium]